ncbi:hypothetical protein [Naasia lichenicola]|uniref:Uncharacterized protein n=1 Tax=Naasia lichenicola TaxID=2565933 RepID=A0A4V3WSM0_9MICO|nr:hypothetical protein [Naasia lichenicola]THG28587.1 hypothetical protein E6C64_17450 [Naasia lichenicola]
MTIHLNDAGLKHAKSLIRAGDVVVDEPGDWSSAQASTSDENAFLEKHGWAEYAEWFLAYDDSENEETKGRFKFPYGDFGKVHRSGVIAAEQRAGSEHDRKVEAAAKELLELIDKD